MYQRKGCSRQTGELKQYVAELAADKAMASRLPELYDPKSQFTPEQKVQVAAVYLMTGSSKETEEVTGVNDATIRDWATRTDWWPIACDLARKFLESKLDKKLDGLLRDALGNLDDRLHNGDDIVTKDGTVVKRAVGARDCAIIASILFEKRAALRGQPGNITERRDATAILDLIRNQSAQHGLAKMVEIDPATVVNPRVDTPADVASGFAGRAEDHGSGDAAQNEKKSAPHLNPESM